MVTASGMVQARLDPRFAGDSMVTTVRIASEPQHVIRQSVFRVTPLNDKRIPLRTQVRWFEPTERPRVGEIWQFEVRLRRPRGFSSPGAFDREAWLFREDIQATGYVVAGKRNRLLEHGRAGFRDQLRRDYLQRLAIAAAGDPSAGIVAAIAVGVRHGIDREQWQDFAISGTSHLMAISGLHVGLAASLLLVITVSLLGSCGYSRNRLDIGTVAAAAGALLYSYLTGFGVPAMRASAMLTLLALALLLRREPSAFRILLLAAFVVYLLAPTAILSPGFALSFAAVSLLLLFSRQRSSAANATTRVARLLARLRSIVAMQVLLLLGLLPLTAGWFHRLPLVAPLANLVLVPVFSFFIIPLALLGLILSNFSDVLFGIATPPLLWAVGQTQLLSSWLADWPTADVRIAGIDRTAIFLCMLVMLWPVLPRQWPGRWLAFIAALAIVLHTPERPATGCFHAHVLDVGQGSAHVVQTRNKLLLFDTGVEYRNGGSVADQVILPFLRHIRVDRIDWLVVSHADLDHAGGTRTLLNSLAVDEVYLGEPTERLTARSTLCRSGQTWTVDGVNFRFLYPVAGEIVTGNNASCVLQVSVGEHSMIFTGDIERPAERRLLDSRQDLSADVVIVPHHGSATSSSAALVQAISPQLAIASTGFANRWSLPKDAVVTRWRRSGARFLDTARSGTISVSLCEEGGVRQVSENRREHWRFWRE